MRVYQTETKAPTSAEGLETQGAIQSVRVELSGRDSSLISKKTLL